MDYEKKYKEALERAKDMLSYKEVRREDMEYLFPELKESEDERIRKELIEHVKDQQSSFISAPDCRDKYEEEENNKYNAWIAWLERQGDKDKLIKELGEYKVKYTQEVLEKHLNNMNNKDNERLRKTTIAFLKDFAEQGYENAVECIDWLEKQGEQKPAEWDEEDEEHYEA